MHVERPMTIEQAAEFCQVSTKTIRRAITAGHLEAHRLGACGALRIRPSALDEWLTVRSTLTETPPRARPVAVPAALPVPARPRAPRPDQRQAAGRLRLTP